MTSRKTIWIVVFLVLIAFALFAEDLIVYICIKADADIKPTTKRECGKS